MANGGGGRRRKGSRRAKVKKKTKYLSLSRHLAQVVEVVDRPESLSVEDSSPPSPLASPSTEEAVRTLEDGGDGGGHAQQQLDPFPLHPETPSMLFAAAPSLNDILGASSSSFSGGGGSGGSSSCAPSPDASGGTGRFEGEGEDLARRALRGRERWVYCRSSSSSPSAATPTTTTSSSCSSAASGSASARSPLLKLDYDEILASWAGRGSLYIGAAAGLSAPKLEPDSVFVEVEPWRQVAAWIAPDTAGRPERGSTPDTAGRAERVRRYKEKRQARLFSKRIRYEVRRINAVRRPRLKGRFIKENEGVAMPT